MRYLGFAVLVAFATPALAADGAVRLTTPSPLRKDLAAMPQIAAPADDAARRINAALTQMDRNVRAAAKDCKGDGWNRTVNVTMAGPAFLSFTVTDEVFCDGNAHPDSGTFAAVHDLATGNPVDWTQMLPATLTGTVTMEDQGDGSKAPTLASKRLFELYMAGYGAGEPPSSDLDECKQALRDQAANGPPAMTIWPDAEAGGLAVQVSLPHVVQACEDSVVIPAATLRAEGARAPLLQAFGAAPHP